MESELIRGDAIAMVSVDLAGELQVLAGLLGQRGERRWIRDGEVGQNLPVDGNVGLFQAVYQTAVRETVKPGGCIDSNDPQRAEISLFLTTVPVCIGKRAIDGVVRGAIKLASPSTIPACGLQYFLSSASRSDAVRRSWHVDGLLVAPGSVRAVSASGPAEPEPQKPRQDGGSHRKSVGTVSWEAGAERGPGRIYAPRRVFAGASCVCCSFLSDYASPLTSCVQSHRTSGV